MCRRLISDYKRYILPFIASTLLALVSTCLALFVPVLMGQGMDAIVGVGDVDFDRLIIIIEKMILAILISAIALWIMNGINNRIVYGISTDLRGRTFKSFVGVRYDYLDTHSEGDIVSRIIVDCDAISDGLLLGFSQFFIGVVTAIVTIVFMIRINIYLAVAVILLTPLSLLVARFIIKNSNKYFEQQAKSRGEMTQVSSDIITMKRVINDEMAEEYFAKKFKGINSKNEKISRKATFYSSLTNPMTRLVNAICYALLTFGGGIFAIQGDITIGGLTSFLAYASQFAKPFNDISSVITELQNSIVCLRRMYELIDAGQEKDMVQGEEEDANEDVESDIAFGHVDFGYTDRKVLSDVTFNIPRNKKMGIVGPTGCGKTTIMKLLLKYYNYDTGEITVGGKDIKRMSADKLRGMMGIMFQETFLITGTVMDNIRMGNDDASDEDVVRAAKECRAHDFIMNLPEGYETQVNENNLSKGQRQLICIARLMLRDSSIILLDEATSSLDILSERLVKEAFDKIMEGRTTVVVAHRLSTIIDADIILVVKDGRIVESGTHKELIEGRGFYHSLYESQLG